MEQISGAGLLGLGMNVVQATPQNAVTAAIVTPVSGCPNTYQYNGTTYCIPNNVSVTPGFGDRTTTGSVIVGASQSEFQQEFAAQFGIEGSYNAFSGSFNAAFASESKTQGQYWYAMLDGEYEAYTLLLDEESGIELSPEFLNDSDVQTMLRQSSFGPSNADVFFRVFDKWGTHYVYQVAMGASIQYYAAVESAYSSDSTTISANLQIEYNAVFVSAAAQSSAEWNSLSQSWSNARTISILSNGGDSSLIGALDPTYGDSFSTQFTSWRASIPANLGVMQFYLRDLSTLLDGATETAVSQALTAYLSCGLFAQASYNVQPGGQNSSIGTLIRVGATTIDPQPPAPANNAGGAIQLVILDSTTLSTLVNVAVYPKDSSDYTRCWGKVLNAVGKVTTTDYFAIVTVSGVMNAAGFPPADVAGWLQSCGATLSAWTAATQLYCGNDYNIGYAFIGLSGAPAGEAIETFVIDQVPGEVGSGYFFANATGPLLPNAGGGAYILI